MDDLELAREAARVGAAIVGEWAGRVGDPDLKGAVDPTGVLSTTPSRRSAKWARGAG